jgi:drug/metabolite transporter (DMT)-like permease
VTRTKATAVGFGAVLLWSLLALLTVLAGRVPPFQLAALAFSVGTLVGLAWIARTGGLRRLRGVRPRVWLIGTAGLFGYHFFYFTALANAPPAQASLIAFLWPLLIVLFSGLLPGERLRPLHVLGALVAFAGAALIVAGPSSAEPGAEPNPGLGYAAALACALIWSSYSVLSRRLGDAPTETVTVFCAASALLSALAHLALETTVWPAGSGSWIAVAGLGLGPVGLAFYLWDIGVKHGDIQMLGTASYAAPLLSTLVLVLAGEAVLTATLAAAAFLVTAGAALAARVGRPGSSSGSSSGSSTPGRKGA